MSYAAATDMDTADMVMIARRTMLAGMAAGVAVPVRAAAPTEDLAFRVTRNGSEIGRHTVAFERTGGDLTVRIAVDIRVGFGPVTLYRYALRATEHWRDGVLMAAEGDTNDDGSKDFLRLSRQDMALVVEGSAAPRFTAPAECLCASHWNRAELAAPMVNIQNGELLRFTVTSAGQERVDVGGQTVMAEHHVLEGKNRLDIWYDDRGAWSALRATAKDGSAIDYTRI